MHGSDGSQHVCLHGVLHYNSVVYDMQALVKYLDNVSDEDIPSLEIPTGVPLIYELDENLKPIKHYYVG